MPSFKFSRTPIRLIIKEDKHDIKNDGNISVCGWIHTMRKQPKISFIQLNDGSTQDCLQVVVSPDFTNASDLEIIKEKGTKGVSIRVEGKLITSQAKGQSVELQAHKIQVYGEVDPKTYPISKKKHGLDYIRQIEHMRIRTQVMSAVARVRNRLAQTTHSYFQSLDCKYVHTPILTTNDCEGAGECFTVTTQYPTDETPVRMYPRKELFKQPAFLTVSGQLHVESYACALGNVYTFGPTFRAENSNTSRHLCEFWMIEPEFCFIEADELFAISEEYVKFCISSVLSNCEDELQFLSRLDNDLLPRLKIIKEQPFQRLTYSEAVEVLQKEETDNPDCQFKEKVEWGMDLSSEHERYLTDRLYKKPVILTHYPKTIKSFYMKENKEDTRVVDCMDVLVPGIGELIGGSMREENYENLSTIVKEKGIQGLDWYLDLRKYGSVPHGGFGLGFERLVQLATGMKNIRDVIPFPRYPKHCKY
jgi:asparaginyl-tRNA synthetase